MTLNKQYYLDKYSSNGFLLCDGDYDAAVVDCVKLGQHSSIWTMAALATVVQRDIVSVYPAANMSGGPDDVNVATLNATLEPRDCVVQGLASMHIMWTRVGPHQGRTWGPTHFVPLMVAEDDEVENAQESSVAFNDTSREVEVGFPVAESTRRSTEVLLGNPLNEQSIDEQINCNNADQDFRVESFNVQFKIIEEASQRGEKKLYDNLGFNYVLNRQTPSTTY